MDELKGINKDIGNYLAILKSAKENPDNFSPFEITLIKDKLSLTLRLRKKHIALHPELRKTRTRQMTFIKELVNYPAHKGRGL